ncbi:expressed unknown protein [Seminavis robusta]|uniref:Uncharacterized protein n=1 Tax=Seminavis robusta TaxID=568900 RepID=A0A9N8H924_9STRA|nr:expressed unknown protein [Seminavis robusta]|eukprot:Sro177_g077700.1 n/a (371) ;mRNA; r:29430-30542
MFLSKLRSDGKLQFQCWLVFLACFYSVIGVVAMLVQLHLASDDQASRWLDYVGTITLSLLYTRALTHHTTLWLLKKWSRTCSTLPSQIQDDSAFCIVDNLTFLMWSPIVSYWVIQGVRLTTEDYIVYCIPSLRALMPYYVADRILHIWVNPTKQRLIHHLGVLITVACFTELNPSVQSLAIGAYGSIVDAFHKAIVAWGTLCRFTRSHSRNHPEWRKGNVDIDARQGIDGLLVGRSPETMAFYGKLGAFHVFMFFIVVPFGTLTVYFARHWHTLPFANRIIQPMIPFFFTLVDVPLYKAYWNTSHQSYWEKDFGNRGGTPDKKKASSSDGGQSLTDQTTPNEAGFLTPTEACFFDHSSREQHYQAPDVDC